MSRRSLRLAGLRRRCGGYPVPNPQNGSAFGGSSRRAVAAILSTGGAFAEGARIHPRDSPGGSKPMSGANRHRPTSLQEVAGWTDTWDAFGFHLKDFLHAFDAARRAGRPVGPMLAEP